MGLATKRHKSHKGACVAPFCDCCAFLWLFVFVFTLADPRTTWNSLVDAERTFAKTSIAKGTKEAFLSVLADDGVIFRPRAVPGRRWMQTNPAPTSQLAWEPDFADISAAGDLGYTTGPWEIRPKPNDAPAAFGHYVTMWRKQPNGEWKVVLDNGISHPRGVPPATVDSPQLPKDLANPVSNNEAAKEKLALAELDKKAPVSLSAYFAAEVRLYRDGSLPFVGRLAAANRLKQNPGSLSCVQIAVQIASSADLAYTYGTAEFRPQDTPKEIEYANYLRIWKKRGDGSWSIVLDMLSPAPKT